MSYQIDKKTGEIVISGFKNGIGSSPFTGFQRMTGMNIRNFPEATYLNTQRVEVTYAVNPPTNNITYIIQYPLNLLNLYALDYSGVPWISTNGGYNWAVIGVALSSTNPHGNGLFIWNSSLFVVTDGHIYCITIGSSGVTGVSWTDLKNTVHNSTPAFQDTPQNAGMNHMSIVAEDTKVYICNGNFIAQLSAIGNFVAGNTATYNFNEQALTLPAGTYPSSNATYLCELRNELVIAAGNRVYTWDKISTSFDTSIPFSEPIGKVLNLKNFIYCFSGVPVVNSTIPQTSIIGRGTIYSYNGSFTSILTKLPDSLAGGFDTTLWTFGGVMIHTDKIFFGVSNSTNAQITGIYSVDPESASPTIQAVSGALNCDYIDLYASSTGNPGLTTALLSLDNVQTGAINTIVNFSSGYRRDSTNYYGFTILDTNGVPGIGSFLSDLIPVGLFLSKKTFGQIEILFADTLVSGDSFTLYSAQGYNLSTTTIATYTATSGETQLSYVFPFNTQGFEWLQIGATFASVTGGSRMIVKEIRIRNM